MIFIQFFFSRLDKGIPNLFLCVCGEKFFRFFPKREKIYAHETYKASHRHSLSILPKVDESARSFTSVVRFKTSKREREHFLSLAHFVSLQHVVVLSWKSSRFSILLFGWRDAKKKKLKRLRWRFGLYPAEQLSPGISFLLFACGDLNAPNFLANSW